MTGKELIKYKSVKKIGTTITTLVEVKQCEFLEKIAGCLANRESSTNCPHNFKRYCGRFVMGVGVVELIFQILEATKYHKNYCYNS